MDMSEYHRHTFGQSRCRTDHSRTMYFTVALSTVEVVEEFKRNLEYND